MNRPFFFTCNDHKKKNGKKKSSGKRYRRCGTYVRCYNVSHCAPAQCLKAAFQLETRYIKSPASSALLHWVGGKGRVCDFGQSWNLFLHKRLAVPLPGGAEGPALVKWGGHIPTCRPGVGTTALYAAEFPTLVV